MTLSWCLESLSLILMKILTHLKLFWRKYVFPCACVCIYSHTAERDSHDKILWFCEKEFYLISPLFLSPVQIIQRSFLEETTVWIPGKCVAEYWVNLLFIALRLNFKFFWQDRSRIRTVFLGRKKNKFLCYECVFPPCNLYFSSLTSPIPVTCLKLFIN